MSRYYRIQPAGLPIVGHRSEASSGVRGGVDVFESAFETLAPDCGIDAYGDEVLVIEAPGHWSNDDVEGVRIDPDTASILARVSVADWIAAWERSLSQDGEKWTHVRRCRFEADGYEDYHVESSDDAALLAVLGV